MCLWYLRRSKRLGLGNLEDWRGSLSRLVRVRGVGSGLGIIPGYSLVQDQLGGRHYIGRRGV